MQGHTLADKPRKTLRATIARHDPELYLRKTKPGVFGSQSGGASGGRLEAPTKSEAVHRRDDRFAEVFYEIHDGLSTLGFLLSLDRRIGGHFVDVRASDKGLVAGSGEDNPTHGGIVASLFEGRFQVRYRALIERVKDT